MADRILTLRELNRATLGRQMLLERATVSVPAAVERLAGLQDGATLVIEPFEKLTKQDRAPLTEEGEQLVRFVEENAKSFDIRFADPG